MKTNRTVHRKKAEVIDCKPGDLVKWYVYSGLAAFLLAGLGGGCFGWFLL